MSTLYADDRVHAPPPQPAIVLEKGQVIANCDDSPMAGVKISLSVIVVVVHVVGGTPLPGRGCAIVE